MSDNDAAAVTWGLVVEALSESAGFTEIEPGFCVVREGSAYVYVSVRPFHDLAIVRLVAQVVGGAEWTEELALYLLKQNTHLMFGAFGFVPDGGCVVLSHTLFGGPSLDAVALRASVMMVATAADELDERIVELSGGKRMQDLLEDSASAALIRHLGPGPSSRPGKR